ncbi:MAG: TraR/DksA family transcriptional regulator [Gemmatimonadaceae bacterium]
MTNEERHALERLLRSERGALVREIERIRLESSSAVSAVAPGDDAQFGVSGSSADDDAAVDARERAALADVEAALRLLEQTPDRYGLCSVCGHAIAMSRLRVVPSTRVCGLHAH